MSGDAFQLGNDGAGHRQRRAFITGLSGTELTADEAHFIETYRPCGFIIFSRNFADNDQLRTLIEDARRALGGGNPLILVDQEGGRVQRLRGPDWPDFPDAESYGRLFETDREAALDAAFHSSQWLGCLLRDVGINTNCVPCLDVPVAGADGIIGNRAYSRRADVVAVLGGAVAAGYMAAHVVPVMKHIPGHGRAGVDSHLALPTVDTGLDELRAQDFAAFAAQRVLPAAMTAHVTYTALDANAPASTSADVIGRIIRSEIGFDGLLMSDDVSMRALAGSIEERSRAVIAAGCDVVLHCNGVLSEMLEVAAAAPLLEGKALSRYEKCIEIVRDIGPTVDVALARSAVERARQA